MTESPDLTRALQLAGRLHGGQLDRSGQPAIRHVLRVVDGAPPGKAKLVAALHDYIEDGGDPERAREAVGGDAEVFAALEAITRNPGEFYSAYIERLAGNKLAVSVKLVDLADNLARTRSDPPSQYRDLRIQRYERAQARLRRASE